MQKLLQRFRIKCNFEAFESKAKMQRQMYWIRYTLISTLIQNDLYLMRWDVFIRYKNIISSHMKCMLVVVVIHAAPNILYMLTLQMAESHFRLVLGTMGQCRMKSLFLKGLRKYSNSQDVVCSKRRRTAHSWMNTTQIRGGNEPRFLKLNKAQSLLKTFQHGKFSVNSWDPGSFNPQLKITDHLVSSLGYRQPEVSSIPKNRILLLRCIKTQ